MKFCGIDLAVKRPSAVGVLEGDIVCVKELMTNEEIYEECKDALVISIDSPLSHSSGYREVDKLMKRRGYKVLPPSWMKSLVDKAISLQKTFSNATVIETHPTSSMKNVNINWKEIDNSKDVVDAIMCALVSLHYHEGKAVEISANDGKIFLLPKGRLEIEKLGNKCFKISSLNPRVSF